MSVTVIGVDPGLSTGVAEIANGFRGSFCQGLPHQAVDFLEHRIQENVKSGVDLTIACERFTQQSGHRVLTQQPEAQQTIGMVQRLCAVYGVELVSQPPADALRIASNDLLRRAGLWIVPSEVGQSDADDVRMAMRHAVLALSRKHATIFESIWCRSGR